MSKHRPTRREKEVRAAIVELGFICDSITQVKGGHLKCEITDDQGNSFKAFTGQSPSCHAATKNFQQDVRRLSMRAKGMIE